MTGIGPSGVAGFYGIAAIGVALVIALANRSYRKEYLSRWSLGWLCAGSADVLIRVLASVAATPLVPEIFQFTLALVVASACWFFLSAGFEMGLRRPLPIRHSRRLLIVLAAAGVVIMIGLTVLGTGITATAVFDSFAIGLAALVTGSLVVWERRRKIPPGLIVYACGLALFGTATLIDGWLLAAGLHVPWLFPLVLFSIAFAGFSILLFAVEDDREAALLAASQIEHIAYYDPLTGLPNRSLFLDRLISLTSQPGFRQQRAALLFVDIDHLKEINDTMGHATGDAVIRAVARRLRKALRRTDTAARFAGDEFTMLLTNLQEEQDVASLARKILSAVSRSIPVGEREVSVTASIGIALFPLHGTDAETLIHNADSAMYKAKKDGRDRFEIYVPTMRSRQVAPLELERALRRAIDNDALSLSYQPIVRLSDRRICGVEALVRWQDEALGSIPATEFIPVAEAASLIAPLGELVLHHACRAASRWADLYPAAGFFVSVNLSAHQFADPQLVARVQRAIHHSGVPPQMLQFEIAESTTMHDVDRSGRVLRMLHDLGVRTALDDFGTGYSSLSWLTRLPIDSLKVDRSFVASSGSEPAAAILSAAVAIGRKLGIDVVAEGIESEKQCALAVEAECEMGQGFFFSRPVDSSEIDRLLIERSGAAEARLPVSSPDAPAATVAEDVRLVLSQADDTLVGARRGPARRVIVADDDPLMRNLMATMLRRVGYRVMQAVDGQEAVDLLNAVGESAIDLLVLDLMMPRLSGWEVLEYVSENFPELSPRVMVVTAAGSRLVNRIDTSLYGEVLEKPFDQADFYDCVARCAARPLDDAGTSPDGEQPIVH
jgi:diguanylate cyclase (GGDEF)-like protein